MSERQALRTAEAWLADFDNAIDRAIVRPDPAKPNKGNIRKAIIGVCMLGLVLTVTAALAGVQP